MIGNTMVAHGGTRAFYFQGEEKQRTERESEEILMQAYLDLQELKRFLLNMEPVRQIHLTRQFKQIGAALPEEVYWQINKILMDNCVEELRSLRKEIAGFLGEGVGKRDAGKRRTRREGEGETRDRQKMDGGREKDRRGEVQDTAKGRQGEEKKTEGKRMRNHPDICIDCNKLPRKVTVKGKKLARCSECNAKKSKEYMDKYLQKKKAPE